MSASMPYKSIVVEDESLIRRNISKKIQELDMGFTVTGEAMDGQNALKLIEKELPHLVVTDIRMPIMDGLELIKNIYFAYPSIKVVIISGYDDFEYARQALRYEVKDYLLKPVTTEMLSSTLTRIKVQLDADLSALVNIAMAKSPSMSPEKLVKSVELYIRENYKSSMTLQDICSKLNFTPDYLSKVFKKCTGESPIKYIIHLRINEAKRILTANPEMDIKTVGELVGYPDPYYFSRIFKNHTGYYPSEYRAMKVE